MLVASVFFWLSAFSVPFIKSIYYVKTRANDVKYGNFGWCANDNRLCYRHVGYSWHPQIIGNDHLTGSLILVALTAGFGSLAMFSLLHSIRDLRSGATSFFLTLFTALLATISFFLVVICWGVAHHRFSRDSLQPKYGAAFVLGIIGWLLYLAAIPFVIIGWFRQRHYRETTTVKRY
ncbi:hypothetical protein DB88DRAFT_453623 [Papiliotrema laurentii]|uniref:Pali-domain-containing protein n=1 Tax=Papiliotrema laurentii TaxID=5418 RepID=A0AAD9CWM9_PAPLA|nr:hypothetical protein DB88DRAFT_453623 [Papiliotrema laurentii]